MSAPGMTNKLATLAITGNPTVDTVIRYGLVAVATGLTGAITGWLDREGFNDKNLVVYVGMGVTSLVGGAALMVWGAIKTSKNEALIKLREAIAVQAGINVAENPSVATPAQVSVPEAQKIIAEHSAPSASAK